MNSAQEIADGIVQLLEKRGQMPLLSEIVERLSAHSASKSKYNTAVIRTSVALNNDERDLLKTQLSDMFGRQLQIEEQLDETIMGGMYIQVGDTVLDYTVSSHLKQIGEQLEK
jgi:F-type H+-transporting ATPase subunit delta